MREAPLRLSDAVALPSARLCIGVTGHRDSNLAFDDMREGVAAALVAIFDIADARAAAAGAAGTRLLSLLANGSDLMAVEHALARGWDVAAPLPFGNALNIAIHSHPSSAVEARAVRDGAGAAAMRALTARVRRFELAEQDDEVARAFDATLDAPGDAAAAAAYTALASARASAAGCVLIEQSDIVVAVWDGVAPGAAGGTRHTIAAALDHGAPVVWIDARDPGRWTILRTPEALGSRMPAHTPADIAALIDAVLAPPGGDAGARAIAFHTEAWHPRSSRRFHAYRRVEAVFGGAGSGFGSLVQTYETPDAIATGSGAALLAAARALPGGAPGFVDGLETQVMRRFAWADGLSTYLSDAYRGGMTTNFLLSAFAILGGVIYLPFADARNKWVFALFELALLVAILVITAIGRRRRWHGRWFETRRVAEYLRHAPILQLLGVARAAGRWPRGSETSWPECYARGVLRGIGLPELVVTHAYLRAALATLLETHARQQRLYHRGKAARLTRVHHNLDRAAEAMFMAAVAAVAVYLALVAGAALGTLAPTVPAAAAKTFTFLGVALPALGGAFAGVRYFGDFERFAAISQAAAEKLESVEARIAVLLEDPARSLRYAEVAALAHALDDIVIAEIESWQSVFAGKQIAVPV